MNGMLRMDADLIRDYPPDLCHPRSIPISHSKSQKRSRRKIERRTLNVERRGTPGSRIADSGIADYTLRITHYSSIVG